MGKRICQISLKLFVVLCYNRSMKTIDEDIKNGTIRPVYLLYGEENYLKRQYRDKLKNALVAEDDTMNFGAYEGKNVNPKELIDLAETLPFFAEKRLLLIENSGFFKGAADELAEYMKSIPPTTCFVFVEDEVDKRSKLYKAVKNAGSIVEFARQKEELLIRWVTGRIRRENKNITNQAMQLFLSMTGSDMENIDKELEKLLCYCLDKDGIYPEDVEAVCTGQLNNRIFDMVNAIAAKDQRQALKLYYDLIELKEPPMRILFLVARQFQILFLVKTMRAQGLDQSVIASKAGIPPFAVGRNVKQASGFTVEQLEQAIEDAVAAEADIKMGRMNDQLAVELFIVTYSKL